jgi:hypothetical protein
VRVFGCRRVTRCVVTTACPMPGQLRARVRPRPHHWTTRSIAPTYGRHRRSHVRDSPPIRLHGGMRTVLFRRGTVLVAVALLSVACTSARPVTTSASASTSTSTSLPHQSVPNSGTLRGVLLQEVGGPTAHPPVPLSGTTVVVKAETGGSWRATTGANGRFSRALPPGTYTLTPVCPLPESVKVRVPAGSTVITRVLCNSDVG